jgi:ferredoxin
VTASIDTWDRLADVVGAPDFIRPWIDRFYEPAEVDLLLALADGPLGMPDLESSLAAAHADPAAVVTHAYRRAVVDLDGGQVRAATFLDRSALWAQFEGWKDVPDGVRAQLADWWLADYTESVRETLTRFRDGHADPGPDADYAYLLLSEAEDVVRSQERVYLWPCDCRTLRGACDQSIYNCIRFANDRDLGWEISKERAIEIIREADRAGLTHTDYVGLGGERDPHAICNCCTDCCQPHLAAERLGVGDVWPRRRHVAHLVPEACTLCGTCVDRCPFGALAIAAGADGGEELVLAASSCRGCGLCATGCPEAAIEMQARAGAV